MQDCKRLGWACCKAVELLHGAGITHTDIRVDNTVWLSDRDAMLIDLERCRYEAVAIPDGLMLNGWDSNTLQKEQSGKKRYTTSSDMYSIGKMLERLLVGKNMSDAAADFIHRLLGKKLTAKQALDHEWLRTEG